MGGPARPLPGRRTAGYLRRGDFRPRWRHGPQRPPRPGRTNRPRHPIPRKVVSSSQVLVLRSHPVVHVVIPTRSENAVFADASLLLILVRLPIVIPSEARNLSLPSAHTAA